MVGKRPVLSNRTWFWKNILKERLGLLPKIGRCLPGDFFESRIEGRLAIKAYLQCETVETVVGILWVVQAPDEFFYSLLVDKITK